MSYRFVSLTSQPAAASSHARQIIGICQVYVEPDNKQAPLVIRHIPAFRVESNIGVYVPAEQTVSSFCGILINEEQHEKQEQKCWIDFQAVSKEEETTNQLSKVSNFKPLPDSEVRPFLHLSACRTQYFLQDHFVGILCTQPKAYPVYIDNGFVALKLGSFSDLSSMVYWVDQDYKMIIGAANTRPQIVFNFIQVVLPVPFEYPYVCTKPVGSKGGDAGPVDYEKFNLNNVACNEMAGLPFAPRSSNQVNQHGQIPYAFPVEESFNQPSYFDAKKIQVPFDFIKTIVASRLSSSSSSKRK